MEADNMDITYTAGTINTCPVCYDDPALYKLDCSHSFCLTCLRRIALATQHPLYGVACPLCRAPFGMTTMSLCGQRILLPDTARAERPSPGACVELLKRGVCLGGVLCADPVLARDLFTACPPQPWAIDAFRKVPLDSWHKHSYAMSAKAADVSPALAQSFLWFRRARIDRDLFLLENLVKEQAHALGITEHAERALIDNAKLHGIDPIETAVTLADGRILSLIQYWVAQNLWGGDDEMHHPRDDPALVARRLPNVRGPALEIVARAVISLRTALLDGSIIDARPLASNSDESRVALFVSQVKIAGNPHWARCMSFRHKCAKQVVRQVVSLLEPGWFSQCDLYGAALDQCTLQFEEKIGRCALCAALPRFYRLPCCVSLKYTEVSCALLRMAAMGEFDRRRTCSGAVQFRIATLPRPEPEHDTSCGGALLGLPDDCLQYIIFCVLSTDAMASLVAMRSTCSRMLRACGDDSMWRQIFITTIAPAYQRPPTWQAETWMASVRRLAMRPRLEYVVVCRACTRRLPADHSNGDDETCDTCGCSQGRARCPTDDDVLGPRLICDDPCVLLADSVLSACTPADLAAQIIRESSIPPERCHVWLAAKRGDDEQGRPMWVPYRLAWAGNSEMLRRRPSPSPPLPTPQPPSAPTWWSCIPRLEDHDNGAPVQLTVRLVVLYTIDRNLPRTMPTCASHALENPLDPFGLTGVHSWYADGANTTFGHALGCADKVCRASWPAAAVRS